LSVRYSFAEITIWGEMAIDSLKGFGYGLNSQEKKKEDIFDIQHVSGKRLSGDSDSPLYTVGNDCVKVRPQ
jgi:hypothetical protein